MDFPRFGMPKFETDLFLPHLSIDCVVFGYERGVLKVLLSKPNYIKNNWSLPGGYIFKNESTDQAATRILKQRTGLDEIFLEQFRVFGEGGRIVDSEEKEEVKIGLAALDPERFDPVAIDWITSRFVCIGYYALVDIQKVQPKTGELEEALDWFGMEEIPVLTYDHREVIYAALQALRQNLDAKLIGFELLPETFTMKEVQVLYEAVYRRSFPMNNFQKKILDLKVLERLEKKFTGASNKAPYLYRFKK